MSFDLFPGFRVPPNDPSREVKWKQAVTIAPQPRDEDDDIDDEPLCNFCQGDGYENCFCGGDFCVCSYEGEIPCWNCQ